MGSTIPISELFLTRSDFVILAPNIIVVDESTGGKVSYTLTATRVDPEELDGMTYDEWSGR